MNRVTINVSGAEGGGSSTKIYETPDYEHPWHGANVMHGSFRAGPTSPDDQQIEVVELQMPGIEFRVKADDVRAELQALGVANKAWSEANHSADKQPARHEAFEALRSAVVGVAGSHITVRHIESAVRAAFDDGVQHGEASMRERFRKLLGL